MSDNQGFGDDMFGVFDDQPSSAETGKSNVTTVRSKAGALLDKIKARQNPAHGIGSKRNVDEDHGQSKKSKKESNETDKPLPKADLHEDLNLAETMPRIQVHRLETVEACTHEVALPPNIEFEPLKLMDAKPAKEYAFILDPFQKESLLCLENQQSVLVSAHTSAGKTVVAEYAIAMSLRDKQRVIYTTPIKALSNQKYRELFEEFQDVGLMTGDVTINPTASCLVMTTEILRSMLYRGSEMMREVAWVVFDEIHYMRDKERGVVWEETIILLPDNVHYVFLSATIPNARQFAEWICFLHKQPCHVVYTEYRPTPLEHYIYPAGGDGIHMVVDSSNQFKEDNFTTAMNVLKDAAGNAKGDQRGRRGGMKGESNCYKIVRLIMEKHFSPVIVFSFSKKDCEAYAMQMAKLDFNSEEEQNLVQEVFNNAIDTLSDEDKTLPQVENVLPLLKKGIGIHHSGLLPLLKETIEILFGEGLIKALFATETFAMGLNMPARTVLFTSARKFDGKELRWITSGEYIQMSGRAGRRGLDDKGLVILMVDEKMSSQAGKEIVKGSPDPLNSAFHLTYNMVLNLLRVEEINPEYMLERSFYQFQNYAAIPELIEKLKNLEKDYGKLEVKNEDQISSYYNLKKQLHNLNKELLAYIQKPMYVLPFLQPGRLVRVVNEDLDFGYCVVVNFQKKANQSQVPIEADPMYVVEVLAHISKVSVSAAPKTSSVRPCSKGETGEMVVIPVMLHLCTHFSAVRLFIPKDLKSRDNRMSVLKSLQEVEKRFPDGVPQLDPIEDMGIKEKGLVSVTKKIEAFEHRIYSHSLHNEPNLGTFYEQYENKVKVANEIKAVKSQLKQKRSLLQMDELRCRKRVLRRMGYATAADVIEIKGRVACEIDSADELIVTEMLFNGVFNTLTPQQCASLLSCFVFQEKANEMPKLTEDLAAPLRQMQDTARRVAKVSKEAKLEIDEELYLDSFKCHMMDVVHAWCNGASFAQLCKMTDIFEGSMIRCFRRLEELLRQMCQAGKNLGNTELENKFAEAIRMIKRDIVFAASLYL